MLPVIFPCSHDPFPKTIILVHGNKVDLDF
jgi:hypothetical protein